ncbi:MAG: hypothetical protein NVSMB33_01250 [Ktedonobacteraceae bacterium]
MKALAKDPQQRFASVQTFANALEEVRRAQEDWSIAPAQQSSVSSSQLLQPTIIAAPLKRGLPPTQRVVAVNTVPVLQTENAGQSQIWQTPDALVPSAKTPLPLGKRLRYALNTGMIAAIVSALLHIVIVLLNAATLRKASAEIVANKLTVNTALALLGTQGLNFFVNLLVCVVAGFVIGKIVARRRPGLLAGVLAGAILYIVIFLVSFIPFYPENTLVGGAGIGGGGIGISLIFLSTWSIIGGLGSLLGSWIATRKHS